MIHPDEHAVDLLTEHAPEFLSKARDLQQRAGKDRHVLEITLDEFDNSPLVLYAALYFCGTHGITVTVEPAAGMGR